MKIYYTSFLIVTKSRCVVANILNCDIVESEFELYLYNYVHFLD